MLQKRSLLRGSTHNFELFAWFERHWVLGEPRFFWFLKYIVSSCRFPFSCCSPLQFQFLHQQISFLSVKSNHNVTGCNPQFWWFKSNFPWWNMFFCHNLFTIFSPPRSRLSRFPSFEAARREAARVAEQQRREAEEQRRKEQDWFLGKMAGIGEFLRLFWWIFMKCCENP